MSSQTKTLFEVVSPFFCSSDRYFHSVFGRNSYLKVNGYSIFKYLKYN